MSSLTSSMRSFMDEVLELDDAIRYAGIFDTKEHTLLSKMKKNKISLKNQKEEEDFVIELQKLKRGQDTFDDILGKISFLQIKREKLTYLVFFAENLTIYFSCEPTLDNQKISKIIDKAEVFLKEYFVPQIHREFPLP